MLNTLIKSFVNKASKIFDDLNISPKNLFHKNGQPNPDLNNNYPGPRLMCDHLVNIGMPVLEVEVPVTIKKPKDRADIPGALRAMLAQDQMFGFSISPEILILLPERCNS